jgi:DNA replication protein DnaC
MEKISTTIQEKENQPMPPTTACKRCGKPAEPKFIALLGWRQQEHCDACQKIISDELDKKAKEDARKNKTAALMGQSGLDKELLMKMAFDSYDPQYRGKAFEIAKHYAESFSVETARGLLFYGRAGSGKTHLACSVARYLIEQKLIGVKFVRIVDLLCDIRKTFDENESYRTENESELIRKYTRVPLLILDDLGSEKTTDWVRQILYQIIDERWLEQMPIIITSNLTLDDLEGRLEERITSRIAGMCQRVEMRDHDYRIRKQTI